MEIIKRLGALMRAGDAPAKSSLEAAWEALTPAEQRTFTLIHACFKPSRIVSSYETTKLYATLIESRGAKLSASPDAYYSFLTYQEQKIVAWCHWRATTRAIIGPGHYERVYKDIVSWRNP